jgi:hypothetical protein
MHKLDSMVAAAIFTAGLIIAPVGHACTAFLVASDTQVLFGNNEDFWNPATKMWFVPAEDGGHGAVFFGFDDLSPQGGMNEAGLAFDGFATEAKPVTGSAGKVGFNGNLVLKVMAECATVDEVLEVFAQYNLAMMERFMLMFADATGDSVIIEGDEFIRKIGAFQVVTNFYQSEDPEGKNAYGEGKACSRFKMANDMLEGARHVDVSQARRILDAVHVEGESNTLYSNIYDLDDRLVYLYSFHDFDNEVVIDLAEELEKGARVVDLPSIFPRNSARERFVAEQEQAMQQRRQERGSVELPVGVLKRYVGIYKGGVGTFEVKIDDGALVLASFGRFPLQLTPTSETEFFEVTLMVDYDVTFRIAEGGEVKGVEVRIFRDDFTMSEHFMERMK